MSTRRDLAPGTSALISVAFSVQRFRVDFGCELQKVCMVSHMIELNAVGTSGRYKIKTNCQVKPNREQLPHHSPFTDHKNEAETMY